MKKTWELYAVDLEFLYQLAKEHKDGADGRFWEIQGQWLAEAERKARGFDTYTDIGGWVVDVFEKKNWSTPKPHILEGIREARRKYMALKEYKYYLFWNFED